MNRQPNTPTQEERPGDNIGGGAPLQLLLSDLRFDVARALLEFIYTGELRRSLDLDSPLPYDLRAAAKSYGVVRLEALCTEAISLGSDPGIGMRDSEDWGQVSDRGYGAAGVAGRDRLFAILPCHLAAHLALVRWLLKLLRSIYL